MFALFFCLQGCIGGSTHRPKTPRSGELAVENGCIVNGEAIYIRCCKIASDEQYSGVSMTSKVSKVEYQANEEYVALHLITRKLVFLFFVF